MMTGIKPPIYIYENNFYGVRIGKSSMGVEGMEEIELYQIQNKKYGIIEIETTVLPSAMLEADNLAKQLEEVIMPSDAPQQEFKFN